VTPAAALVYEVDLRAALEAAGVIFVEENGEGRARGCGR
jgi:hypothetical protein